MPHIIYKGTADLAAAHAAFSPVTRNENDWIIKLMHAYLSEDRTALLFETVSVRSGFSQNYYARAEIKSGQITIRVDPRTNVEKNEGVKRGLVAIRDFLLSLEPGLVFDKTNLPDELLK